MALELSNQVFLVSSSTAVMYPASGAHGCCFWFYMPATVSAQMTLVEWTNGTDSSRLTFSLDTSKRLVLSGSTSLGVAGSVTSAALATGWHFLAGGGGAVNSALIYSIDGGSTFVLGFINRPSTALTEWNVGRKADGTEICTGTKIIYYFVGASAVSGAEITNIYNGGVAINPTALADGETAVVPFINDMLATTGTVAFACGVEPTFVSDTDVRGVAWTASAIQTMPSIRNGDVLFTNANFDLLMFSDSFGVPATSRLAYHLANELARAAGYPIKKLLQGYRTGASASGNPIVAVLADLVGTIVDDTNNYGWENDGTPIQMAMPLDEGIEVIAEDAVESAKYLTLQFRNPGTYTGPVTTWIQSGDTLTVNPILRVPTANGVTVYQLQDSNGDTSERSVLGSAGIPTPQGSFPLTVDVSGGRDLAIRPDTGSWTTSLTPDGAWLDFVGVVGNNTSRGKGIGFGSVAGSSWSVSGHNVNATSSGGTPKQYTDAEIQGVIEAFYHPQRKLIFCLSIATESSMQTPVETWITRLATRCANLGITNYGVLLISQFCHNLGGGDADGNADRNGARNAAIAFDTIAQANPLVCHVSLYKLLNGSYFHTAAGFTGAVDDNDANGPQQKFLADYDTLYGTTYATTPGRTMLDSSNLHLNSLEAPQFMAEVIAREILANASTEPTGNAFTQQQLLIPSAA